LISFHSLKQEIAMISPVASNAVATAATLTGVDPAPLPRGGDPDDVNGEALAEVPGLLAARMLNEFAYCPRLAYLEWVQGEFVHNLETLEGRFGHRRVDEPTRGEVPGAARERSREKVESGDTVDAASCRIIDEPPEDGTPAASGDLFDSSTLSTASALRLENPACDKPIHARSLMLSAPDEGLICKMDVLELEGSVATPVDYKRGKAPDIAEGAWEPERVQVCAQGLILREAGYRSDEGVLYFIESKTRVPVVFDDDLVARTRQLIGAMRKMGRDRIMPPPLVDSPKCPRCSLVGICLPDETNFLREITTVEESKGESVEESRETGAESLITSAFDGIEFEAHGIVERLPGAARERSEERGERGDQLTGGDTPPALPLLRGGESDGRAADSSTFLTSLTPAARSATSTLFPPSPRPGVRKLLPSRDDALPLYVQEQGASLGKSGDRLTVKEKGKLIHSVRMIDVSQVSLFGNVQVSAQAVRELAERGVPLCHFSYGGWLSAITSGLVHKNVELRIRQFAVAGDARAALQLSRQFIVGKIKNCRTLLRRHLPSANPATGEHPDVLRQLADLAEQAGRASCAETLLGIEGMAAKLYFAGFAKLLKGGKSFNINGRNRRPPTDPTNALLSFVYSMLARELTVVLQAVGFDPLLGFFHRPRYGRPSLALDLAEEFRPLIADSTVLTLVNNGEVCPQSFICRGGAVALTTAGRRAVIDAFERRLETEITHPIFGYKVSYRRILEVQARLLSRVLLGDLSEYPNFCTR
jgi:CRISPR-associated protein Cas1